MRFVTFNSPAGKGLAIASVAGRLTGLLESADNFPGHLEDLIAGGDDELHRAAQILESGVKIDREEIDFLPPLRAPGKIICIGLNYVDHTAEMKFEAPEYPTVFARWASTLIGHEVDLVKPPVSDQIDFEGEIAAIIGKPCYQATPENALDHIAGYSIFNDASIRDYQLKSTQWTMGKNFDGTGAFGPEFVSTDELPEGVKGLKIETLLNGETVQSANTDDMVFSVTTLIVELSAVMTLDPGDVIVTGTPAGVGMARTPPLWLKPGDLVEVKVESLGTLSNRIAE